MLASIAAADAAGEPLSAFQLVANVCVIGVPLLLADLLREQRRLLAQVRDQCGRLAQLRAAEAGEAAARERVRIARDVHDVVGNALSAIAVQAGAGRTLVDADPEEARATFERIARDGARGAGPDARRGPRHARCRRRRRARRAPGLADLDTLLDAVRASGVEVRVLRRPADDALTADVQAATFRIVQEALTNVARYARPPRAAVSIHLTNGEAFIDVKDDGARRTGPSAAAAASPACASARRSSAGGSTPARARTVSAGASTPCCRRAGERAESMTAIRVLLADDQAVVRRGLRTILEAEPDIEIVGEAADGVEAVALAHRRAADLVLMDVRMPRMDGLAATRLLAHPAAASRSTCSSSRRSTSTRWSSPRCAPAPPASC